MKYIGAKAVIEDCELDTEKGDMRTARHGHIDIEDLSEYTKVLDWAEVRELVAKLGYYKENVIHEYGRVDVVIIRYKMAKKVSGTLDDIIIVKYDFARKMRTVSLSNGKTLDTDDQVIRKAILSAEEIEEENRREQGKEG